MTHLEISCPDCGGVLDHSGVAEHMGYAECVNPDCEVSHLVVETNEIVRWTDAKIITQNQEKDEAS